MMIKFSPFLILVLLCNTVSAQWNFVGKEGISNGWTLNNDIETDSSGNPVIIFYDDYSKASCMLFNGTKWEHVGNPTFNNFSIAELLDFKIDNKNNYCILYLDADYNTSCIRFDGDTWGFVGSQYISSEYSVYKSLAIDTSGIVYIAMQSQSGFSIVREDGESWIPESIEGLSGVDRYFDLVINKDNVAFIGYCGTDGKVPYCSKLANDIWEPIGNTISFSYFVSETHLHITDKHEIYMGFLDPDMGFYRFDAQSNKWAEIETAGLGENYMGTLDIISDSSSNIYIAIQSDKARCFTYSESNWDQVGNSGISVSETAYLRIAINKYENLYATYNDFPVGKAVVKEYVKPNDIEDVLRNETLKLYPNPAKDQFCIELTGQKFSVIISDVNGQLVYKNINCIDRIEIDAKGLGKGLYIMRIRSVKGSYHNRKLIVI